MAVSSDVSVWSCRAFSALRKQSFVGDDARLFIGTALVEESTVLGGTSDSFAVAFIIGRRLDGKLVRIIIKFDAIMYWPF
jgi:hypothetical protein